MRVAASLLAGGAALGLIGCSPTPSASPAASRTPTFTSAPTIEPTVEPTILPTAVAATAGAAACTAADLKASHGLVEGAAGSRLTTVVLVAQVTCSIDAFPAFGLRDANGGALVGGTAGGPGTIDLDPNASYQVDVRLANWCAPDPSFPVTLELKIGAEEVAVTGSSFPEQGDMAPCNGDGGPILEAGAWAVSG
jgi:Protein of unknown function (DUF4232)